MSYADDWDEGDFENTNAEEQIDSEIAHIHTMQEGRRSRPLKVIGLIQDFEVYVLIDTGSDRDFLHPRVAEKLPLPRSAIRPFREIVGNGEALLCTHISRQMMLVIQGMTFLVDLHVYLCTALMWYWGWIGWSC